MGDALGLHINKDHHASKVSDKDVFPRVWWGHCAMESLMATMTGHPGIGLSFATSIQLLLPLPSANIEGKIIRARLEHSETMAIEVSSTLR